MVYCRKCNAKIISGYFGNGPEAIENMEKIAKECEKKGRKAIFSPVALLVLAYITHFIFSSYIVVIFDLL